MGMQLQNNHPMWLRAMRPREQEREQDSKFTALLGTPALGTNLKATTDSVKKWEGGDREQVKMGE